MKFIPSLIIICAIFLFTGCNHHSHKLTFEEQQMQDAKQQCQQEATTMNPESPNSMNPLWSSYFVMCMNRFGYTDEQINKLWY